MINEKDLEKDKVYYIIVHWKDKYKPGHYLVNAGYVRSVVATYKAKWKPSYDRSNGEEIMIKNDNIITFQEYSSGIFLISARLHFSERVVSGSRISEKVYIYESEDEMKVALTTKFLTGEL